MIAYSLCPNSITSYHVRSPKTFEENLKIEREKPAEIEKNLKNLKIKRSKNHLSNSAKKRLKNKINWMYYLSQERKIKINDKVKIRNFRLAFVTLHLPSKQIHPHSEIVAKCLNNFLTLLRNSYNVRNYVWRAELQKSGNLHFHIFFDNYIDHRVLRNLWNQSIEILGYVTRYKEKFEKMTFKNYVHLRNPQSKKELENAKKAYKFGNTTNWKSPNSTDVHSLRNIENAAAYVIKYVTKEKPENPSIDYENSEKLLTGRLWFCSQSLSRMKNVTIANNSGTLLFFNRLIENTKNFILYDDFFTYIGFNLSNLSRDIAEFFEELLWSYARSNHYPVPWLNLNAA